MIRKPKSLKDLLFVHELMFIVLILLSATVDGFGISQQDKSQLNNVL